MCYLLQPVNFLSNPYFLIIMGENKSLEPSLFNGVDASLSNKVIINSVESVKIKGKEFLARIDTGATRNSISRDIVKQLQLGPVVDKVEVRNAHGKTKRDIILIEVELAGVKTKSKFNVSNRTSMKYPILIGRNLIKKGFLVDCSNEDRYN